MALPSLTLRTVLAACTGLLLLGGIAGAATVDAGSGPVKARVALAPNDTTATGGSTTPTSSGVDGAAAGPAAPGAVTTATTAGASPATVAGPTTTVRLGGSGLPGPLVAPKPGDYAYEARSKSSSGARTDRAVTNVEAAGKEGTTTIQAVTIPLELGGQHAVARNTVAWGAGAVVRRSVITLTVFGQPGQLDCAWQPAFAQYAGGLAVGKTWGFDTHCAGKVQGFDVTVQQRASRRVTGAALVTGPAGPVATWTIADDTTIVVTSQLGAGTVHMVGTLSLATSLGLPVASEVTTAASMPGSAPDQSTLTTKLVSLP